MIQVFHNSRCSKSNQCLAFLDHANIAYEVVKYLETPPTEEELKTVIKKLGINAIELVRKKEPIWIEKFKNKKMTNGMVIKAMVKYPILIERPIVIKGDKAIIARPLEKVQEII